MHSADRRSHAAPRRWRSRWTALATALLAAALFGALPPEAAAKPEPNVAEGAKDAELAKADRLEAEVETLAKEYRVEEALPKAREVYGIRKKYLPATDLKLASAMVDLGTIHLMGDDLKRSEPLLLKAVELLQRAHRATKEHANAVSNLSGFYHRAGQSSRARELAEHALVLYEKALGPEASEVALAQRVVALRTASQNYDRADRLLQSAIDIHDKLGDKRGSIVARLALGNLRKAYAKPHYVELYNEAIARAKTGIDPFDLVNGELYRSLAIANRRAAFGFVTAEQRKEILALSNRQFAKAERVFIHNFGARHTKLSGLYAEWSIHAQAAHDLDRAIELRAKSNDIEDEHLDSVLAHSTESAKIAYLRKLDSHANDTLSLHLLSYLAQHKSQQAARLALTTVLRRKGRALDSVASTLALLRRRLGPNDQQLVDELIQSRARLSALTIRGPGEMPAAEYKRRSDELTRQEARLEAELAAKSAGFKRVSPAVTIEAVQAALPKDSALVEFAQVTPRNAKAYSGQARYVRATGRTTNPTYVAYVLRDKGPILFVTMDRARTIDKVVAQVRQAMKDPGKNPVEPGERLFRLTLGRFHDLLDQTKHLFIAPEGALNLVPFAALHDGKSFLVERYSFSYLSSGRDLLRFRSASEASAQALVVANPAFDLGGPAAAASPGGTRGGDLSRARFPALPGTAEEALAIGKLLPGAKQLTGAKATEAALKQVQGPELLHVATHGFFLKNAVAGRRGSRGLELEADAPTGRPKGGQQRRPPGRADPLQPLLRSGIALSGANQRRGDAEDDGVLTGLEAAGLDLHGTKLVVLSACETGLGETAPGEGVFGLRRALVIAGSETQVMSLWKVDDEATRDLMTAYYQKLVAGEGRAAAMRDVQRDMAQQGPRKHPFYWGAFIVSGDPAPLELDDPTTPGGGKAAGGEVPGVEPGARGCGCRTLGRPSNAAPLQSDWLLALTLGALWRRRRRSRARRQHLPQHATLTGLPAQSTAAARPAACR